ncbi:MAG TPA: Holliday junction resolvase RuvX [Cryomorphaceae bacterium]|nr:Holliday junction resolvase RuvX [Owenweeksia sp.]MBG00384.1 Holliday junction resolvase RuvX [Owenweeksia sp.]HAD96237.1 Holliday junction resolvase RuvX [Cryomorphaceae bacterium]HBF20263.1 Holliday junction resolvase RuvX [Cryomorphaceae bacterium]
MAKLIALDIGGKRTGIAETDFLQMVASPRETVATDNLMGHLKAMMQEESFELIVVGDPKNLDGGDSHNSERVRQWVADIVKTFPGIPVELEDERFSSKMAVDLMVRGGMKKKQRRQKGEVDKVSAAVILQSYLNRR